MPTHSVLKYGFRIRTRSGVVVENLSISGRDEPEARRKLFQIYNGCEIIESHCLHGHVGSRQGRVSYEDVMDMIVAG